MHEAVVVDCLRTAIGKAPRGTLRNTRPDDLAAARAIQDGLLIAARAGRTPGAGVGRDAAWNEYFGRASVLISDNPPPATDSSVPPSWTHGGIAASSPVPAAV